VGGERTLAWGAGSAGLRQSPTFAPDAQKVVLEDEAELAEEASPIVRKRLKGHVVRLWRRG
jgi:hypothetical protein